MLFPEIKVRLQATICRMVLLKSDLKFGLKDVAGPDIF